MLPPADDKQTSWPGCIVQGSGSPSCPGLRSL